MSLTWTPEMKAIAKRKRKGLVKLQVQLKHSGGGDFQIVGPFDVEHAQSILTLAMLDEEERRKVADYIAKIVLEKSKKGDHVAGRSRR